MKRGFLTSSSSTSSKSEKAKEPADVSAEIIGPDAKSNDVSPSPPPPPPPPLPPQEPCVIEVACDHVTLHWQFGVVAEDERDKGRKAVKGSDSPSRPGREPTGGDEGEGGNGGEGEDTTREVGSVDIITPRCRSSIVLLDEARRDDEGGDATREGKKQIDKETDGTWDESLFGGAGGFAVKLSGLEPGCDYNALARMYTGDHGEIDSTIVSFSTAPSHPARPDLPVVSGKGKNFIKLRWAAPSGRGAAVAQYEVEIRDCSRALSTNSKGASPKGNAASDAEHIEAWGCGVQVHQGPETRCEIKGLRPGTSLQARVRAFNAVGTSVPSPWLTVCTSPTVPSPPARPFVGQGNIGNLLFGWCESEESGGAAIESYCFEVDDGLGDGFMVKYNGPERQWLLTNTVCGHLYKVRVKATNSVGTSPWSDVLEVPGMCGPPNSPGVPEKMEAPPTARSAGPSFSLCLRWAPPSSDNGSRVQLYQVVMRRILDGVAVEFFQVVYAGPETWCLVQGLFPATFYEFGLVAVSLLGTSPPSPTAIFSTAGAPPGPPPAPFLLGTQGSDIHVGWALPDVCNGSPVSSFVLESLLPNEEMLDEATGQPTDWIPRLQYEGSGLSHWIRGLRPGIAVWLRVAGVNAHGQGSFSAPVNVMTPCAAPGKVLLVSAAATGPGKACVRWEAPALHGGKPVTGYRVSVSRKGAGNNEPILVCVDGPGPAFVEGLLAGTMYQAKVQAVNAVGVGEMSDACVFASEAGPPSAPKKPVVTHVTTDSVGLSWEKPTCDNGSAVEEFTLEMQQTTATVSAEATGAAKNVWKEIYTGSFQSFQVGALQPGGLYRFRVRGRNAAGNGAFSPPVLASTEAVPPGPPLAVTVLSVTSKELKLKWSAPAFDGGSDITSFAVMLESGGNQREVYRGAASSCKIKVAPDSDYVLQVVAYTVVGSGTPSAPVPITTPAAASVAVRARAPTVMAPPTVNIKGQGVHVSWVPCRDAQPAVVCYHVSAQAEDADADEPAARVCYSGAATNTEVRDLAPGVSYRLRVCAENEVGKGPWSPATVCFQKSAEKRSSKSAPPLPPPPVDLVLEKATRTSLRVSWQAARSANSSSAPGAKASRRSAALENGMEMFRVQIAEETGEYETVGEGLVKKEFTFGKLNPGTRYKVRVQGQTQKRGASGWSDECSLCTLGKPDPKDVYVGYLFMCCFVVLLFYVVFGGE